MYTNSSLNICLNYNGWLFRNKFSSLLRLSCIICFIISFLISNFGITGCHGETVAGIDGDNLTKAISDFKYGSNGPMFWYEAYKACGGLVQSPINIDTSTSLRVHHPHLFWWNYNRKPSNMSLTNNGHTVVLSGQWPSSRTPYFWRSSTEGTEDSSTLDHIHFHWGLQENSGSEHLLNNKGFPLEMHAVHYSSKYSDIAQALINNEGVKVVSIFFMKSEVRNPALDPIVSALPQIRNPGLVSIAPFEIGKLLARFPKAFITYNGSLTTPPCSEAVTWHIRLTPSTISHEQLDEFRKLKGHDGSLIAGNVRPIQPLNGRTIFHVT